MFIFVLLLTGCRDNTDENIPEYLFKLFIADRGNSRVAVWNELPIMPEEEDKAL